MLRVLNPVARAVVDRHDLAPRLTDLEGVRLGVLSNGKPNAANLMRTAQRRMQERFNVSDVVFVDKVASGQYGDAAPEWMLEQLSQCSAVLHGSGD
jgi:hypothetical protein